jgi:FkbM family methyltransferase
MNKLLRSLLLMSPKTYNLLYHIKNAYFLNFYFKTIHEEDFKAFSLMSSQKPQLFLDIGANVGMSALSIFCLKPNAQVISFEPNPINYPYLDKVVDKFANFEYHKIGLGDRETTLEFYYPIYNGKPMTALGSFNYKNAAQWLSSQTVYFFDERKLKIEKITVEVKTLDSFNLNPDFIKIDVEGFEHKVLVGAQKTLDRCRPILLIEGVAPQDSTDTFLKARDYYIYKFQKNRFYANDYKSANNFFIPQEKLYFIEAYENSINKSQLPGLIQID